MAARKVAKQPLLQGVGACLRLVRGRSLAGERPPSKSSIRVYPNAYEIDFGVARFGATGHLAVANEKLQPFRDWLRAKEL